MAIVSHTSPNLTCHIVKEDLTVDVLMRILKEFWEGNPTQNVLWDLREATMRRLTQDEIQMVASYTSTHPEKKRGGKTAFVVSRDVDYGVGRIIEALTGHLHYEIQVFRTFKEATEWLDVEKNGLPS